jgi:hypothetical protein
MDGKDAFKEAQMKKLALVLVSSLFSSALAFGGDTLDLDDPEDAVKALRKTQCHLEDGKPAVYWWTGNVYSRVPGEKDRHLFSYQAMNVRACKTLSDPENGYGYRMVSREALIYLDSATGEVVRTWTNPWTNEEVEVVHIYNDPVNSKFPVFARSRRGPFQLGATFKDGRGWFSFEVPLFYTNPLGGEYQEYIGGTYQAIEMFNFFFDETAMLDASVGGLDNTHVSWSRVSKWLPWMKMGDRAGQMIYNGAGKRVASWDELPEILKNELMTQKPEYSEPPPLDDARPNETSWTYFKKVIDAQRAEAE